MELEREQGELLDALVEDARSVPRSERKDFVLFRAQNRDLLKGSGRTGFPHFQASDLHVLHDAGLIGISKYTKSGGFVFHLTPEGFRHYEERKREAGMPTEQVAGDRPIPRHGPFPGRLPDGVREVERGGRPSLG